MKLIDKLKEKVNNMSDVEFQASLMAIGFIGVGIACGIMGYDRGKVVGMRIGAKAGKDHQLMKDEHWLTCMTKAGLIKWFNPDNGEPLIVDRVEDIVLKDEWVTRIKTFMNT